MKKRKKLLSKFKQVVVLAGILLASILTFFLPESFALTIIDFDKITANPFASLTNQYANVGAIFTNATVVRAGYGGSGAVSLPNGVGMWGPNQSTSVTFFMPGTSQPAVTDFISVYVGDWSGETDPIIVTAYDIQDNIVGTGPYTSSYTGLEPYGGDFCQITISAAGIHRLELKDLDPSRADFDDLCFNALTPTKTVDLFVKDIKVIQVSENLPLVAQKKTMVRVDVDFTSQDPSINEVKDVTVELDYAGKKYTKTQTIKRKQDYTAPEKKWCKDAFIFLDVERRMQGNYTVTATATIDPANNISEAPEDNNVLSKPFVMQNMKNLKLLFIPIIINGVVPTDAGFDNQKKFLTTIYPIADTNTLLNKLLKLDVGSLKLETEK